MSRASVLGHLLYLIYTADISISTNVEIANFTDDTIADLNSSLEILMRQYQGSYANIHRR